MAGAIRVFVFETCISVSFPQSHDLSVLKEPRTCARTFELSGIVLTSFHRLQPLPCQNSNRNSDKSMTVVGFRRCTASVWGVEETAKWVRGHPADRNVTLERWLRTLGDRETGCNAFHCDAPRVSRLKLRSILSSLFFRNSAFHT